LTAKAEKKNNIENYYNSSTVHSKYLAKALGSTEYYNNDKQYTADF